MNVRFCSMLALAAMLAASTVWQSFADACCSVGHKSHDAAYVRSVLAAGASGYLLKRTVDTEMLTAIRAVHRGGTFVDPSLAKVLFQDLQVKRGTRGRPARPANILSDREQQVLKLVAQGYGSEQIAKRILVSVKTVETYRARIADKLELRTRSELVRYAIRMGLLAAESLES